jgi:hypothetical protein
MNALKRLNNKSPLALAMSMAEVLASTGLAASFLIPRYFWVSRLQLLIDPFISMVCILPIMYAYQRPSPTDKNFDKQQKAIESTEPEKADRT